MSFEKISDYNKRNELVKRYLRLKKELNDRFISERIGEDYKKEQLEEQSKPITDVIKKQTDLFTNEFAKQQANQNQNQNQLAIEYNPEEEESSEEKQKGINIRTSPLAAEYLLFGINENVGYDRMYGIKMNEEGDFILGNKKIFIKDDNILIGDQMFPGTRGLYELITRTTPNVNEITMDDIAYYSEIMYRTNNLFDQRGNLKRTSTVKYREYIRDIINHYYPKKKEVKKVVGEGITLPCDPNELLQRMDLLFASKEAGNTGVNDELIAIIKSLYKKKIIDKNILKILSEKALG